MNKTIEARHALVEYAGDKLPADYYQDVDFWYGFLKEKVIAHTYFGSSVNLEKFGGKGQIQGAETYEGMVLPGLIVDILRQAKNQEEIPLNFLDHCIDVLGNDYPLVKGIATLGVCLKTMGVEDEKIKERLFNESIKNELPRGYWEPIFRSMSHWLPKELEYVG